MYKSDKLKLIISNPPYTFLYLSCVNGQLYLFCSELLLKLYLELICQGGFHGNKIFLFAL